MKFICYACFTHSFLISKKNITTALNRFEVYMLKVYIIKWFVTLFDSIGQNFISMIAITKSQHSQISD
jgi:hypothetical protein